MAKRSLALKPGSKIAELSAFIKREMVSTEMVISREMTRQIAEQLKIKKSDSVYDMIRILEKKGIINRKRQKTSKGIIVSFPTTEPELESQQPQEEKRNRRSGRSKRSEKKPKRSRGAENSPTIDELISDLGTEIEDLKKKLDARIKLHDQLVAARVQLNKRR